MSDRVRAIAMEALTLSTCARSGNTSRSASWTTRQVRCVYLSHENLSWLLPSLAGGVASGRRAARRRGGAACAAPLLLDWRLAPDNDHAVIVLKLKASNAVEVAFRLPAPAASALGQALLKGCTPRPLRPARLVRLNH